MESFLRCIADVHGVRLEVVALAVRRGHRERADRFGREFARDLEVAVVIAVVAEHEIDMHRVSGANDVDVGLHPSVVGGSDRSECDEAAEGKETIHEGESREVV